MDEGEKKYISLVSLMSPGKIRVLAMEDLRVVIILWHGMILTRMSGGVLPISEQLSGYHSYRYRLSRTKSGPDLGISQLAPQDLLIRVSMG